MLFSDGYDSGTEQTIATSKRMAQSLEYFTYGSINTWSADEGGPLSLAYKQLEMEDPKRFGFAVLTKEPSSIFQAIKKWFGKK
jgi:uncharacterized sporulation protein YeaH/YhbH (DUF444 family)